MEGTADLHTTNKLKNLKPTGNKMMASGVSTGVMKDVRIHHTSLTGLGNFLSILEDLAISPAFSCTVWLKISIS